MTVKAVTRYEAEDGTLFDDINLARSHNAKQKAMNNFKQAVLSVDPSHSLGLLHINAMLYPNRIKALRDACNKIMDYHRHYGKLKKD